jgi:hypothetical protein
MGFRTDLTLNIGGRVDAKALAELGVELVDNDILAPRSGTADDMSLAKIVAECSEYDGPVGRVSHWEGCLSIEVEDVRPWYLNDLAAICASHDLSYDIVYASTEEGPGALESWRPGMDYASYVFLDVDGGPQIDRDKVEQALALLSATGATAFTQQAVDLLRQALGQRDALPILEVVPDGA